MILITLDIILLMVSQNITCFSPAAVFTFLGIDIMTTGISEERKLKRAASQYYDSLKVWNRKNDKEKGKYPVFSYQRSSLKEVFGPKSLSNCLILILCNILFFTGASVVFLRYDVR